MGHLKLSPPDEVLSPRFTRRLKSEAEANGRLLGAEDLTLAKIAERFAPGVQSVVAPDDRRFDHNAPRISSILASSPGIRALVAVLIIVALLPSLTFGAMFWLGLINTSWSTPVAPEHNKSAHPPVQAASVAGMSVPARDQLKQTAEIPPVALTAPITLEAKAGEDIPLTIALVRTDALPARSIIAVSGLPHGSTLSSGRPYGEREWNLRPDEIGDLQLVLPNTASGETKLRIDLVAPDGESIANAETLLKVMAQPNASALVVSPRDSERPPELEVSDFSGVRAYFGSATQDGSNNATLALGAAYDLIFAPRSGVYGIKPEPLAALGWSDQSQEVESSGVDAKPKDPEAAKASDEGPVQTAIPPAQAAADATHSWIELSEFVNLREGPSSSARVIGVMEKGSKLHAIGRKRGWVQVTNAATSETGWIYARYVATVTKSRHGTKKAVPSRVGPGSDDSFWTRLGQWLTGP